MLKCRTSNRADNRTAMFQKVIPDRILAPESTPFTIPHNICWVAMRSEAKSMLGVNGEGIENDVGHCNVKKVMLLDSESLYGFEFAHWQVTCY